MSAKHVRAAAVIGAAALALAGCSGGGGSDGVTLSIALPTTGGSAVLGEPMKHGIEMAVDEINAAGGIDGTPIELTHVDLGADDTDALNAFNRAVSGKPTAVIGFPVSTQGFAVTTQVDRSGIPVIMGGTNPGLAKSSDWVFNMTSSDEITTRAAAEFAAKSLGVRKVALLRESGELGSGASQMLTAAAKDLGFEIVTEQIFQTGDVDLSTQANAIRGAGADMLFTYGQQADYIVVSNALATAGVKLPTFIAGLQPGTYKQLNYDGFATIYNRNQCIPSAAKDGDALAKWSASYKEKYSTDPTEYAAIAYDGVHLVADAIAAAGSTDPADVAAALSALPETEGVCGVHKGSETGALSFGVTIGHYDNGAYVVDKQLSLVP